MKRIAPVATLSFLLLSIPSAEAVPSFARQTGLSCNVCHSDPPELTAFGRNFKLKGYVLTDMSPTDKIGNSKSLLLSKYIPLSAMILLSDTGSGWRKNISSSAKLAACSNSKATPT